MKHFLLFVFVVLISVTVPAQKTADSLPLAKKERKTDTAYLRRHNPRKATLYSAIIPGWGQAYNRKYWKMPIIYTALGISAERFFSNKKEYDRVRRAFILKSDTIPGNDYLIDADLQRLDVNALSYYRREFRKNMDYSVLFFVIFWGLNVADAAVDAHLKHFDVNDNLSIKIKPGFLPNSNAAGITLLFDIHKTKQKPLGVK
jgi:hypothetical protein